MSEGDGAGAAAETCSIEFDLAGGLTILPVDAYARPRLWLLALNERALPGDAFLIEERLLDTLTMGRRIALCLVLTRRHMHGFLEDRQHMASEAFYRDNPQAEASFLAIAARMIRNMNAYQKRPDAPLWKEAEESATA